MNVPPWPVVGVVMAHDASNDALTIAFPSLQMPGLSVRRLYDGSADSFRINKKPLPVKGTHGLVIFPHGDLRNPVWLGAIQQNLQDAIPSDQNDPFMHYDSHFSGHWNLLDQYGNYATQFADSSTLVINASGAALPTTYRNIVDEKQMRQRKQYPFSDRQPNPPPPFAMAFTQAASGGNGGCSFTVDASGNSTLSSSVTGKTSTITYNGATIRIDGSGNIQLTPAGGAFAVVNGTLHVTGNVVAGFGGGDSVTLQNHTHNGVTTGSGHTNQPDAGT